MPWERPKEIAKSQKKRIGIVMSCGIGHRCDLDPALLWHGPAAIAPIRPLAWKIPYAAGAALKNRTKNKNM